MPRKLTQEQFIEKAKEVHGEDRYDYSQVVYNGCHAEIIIICTKCKTSFSQRANNHLNGNGCFECGMPNQRLTKERFIEKARQKHGDKYDYSNIIYVNMHTKITIVCNESKVSFEQTPKVHLSKNRYVECEKQSKEQRERHFGEQFIEKAMKKHGNKYDYSKVIYIDNKNKVIIMCNKCKTSFEQAPSNHLRGYNCLSCEMANQRFTKEQFIEKARKKHGDKYDYSNVVYVNSYTKVSIMCNKCKISFEQMGNSHLCGQGCPRCAHSNYSKISIEWLKYLETKHNIKIQHAENGGEYRIPNTKYRVDGYCKDTNTVFEFHGDFWHGNPEIFDAEQQSEIGYITFGELYKKTIEKENIIKSLGYNLIVIWENEWRKMKINE